MAVTNLCGFHFGYEFVRLTALICLMASGVISQETALRSPGGSLLCPLVEEFYSYKLSAAYGPSKWGEISECCLGHKQSPRDLQSSSPSLCGNGQPFEFNYNSNRTLPGSLYNNGHDPNIAFIWPNSASLHNTPYTNGTYILDNIHVHFCTEEKGSEHAIDGHLYQGEIHMVHYKASYGSVANAVLHEDGLVVIAIMLQSTSHGGNLNPEMVKIIHRMSSLQGIGKEFQLPIEVNVAKLFPTSTHFYTYHGSLTSPPCSEAVRWIIFREPIHVTSYEVTQCTLPLSLIQPVSVTH